MAYIPLQTFGFGWYFPEYDYSGKIYSNFTVEGRVVLSMPPNVYTTITIPEETTEKLTQLTIQHELETMSEAVEYAIDSTLTNDNLCDSELAQLLYQRLRSADTHS